MNYPRNAQTTSTQQGLGKGPKDMPDRGGPKVNPQTTSSRIPLGRKELPVAAFGAKPGQGQVQCGSSTAGLSKSVAAPYGEIAATKPQVPLKGKGRKR